ncbi:MAG: type II secretion system minor pseudopilin GspH [Tahibacter sp.]
MSVRNTPVAKGFTLIEVLVVVVILAVLAAAVSMSLAGGGGERQLEREAQRIEALLRYVCERAEISGRQIGVSFDPEGYFFSETEPDGWHAIKDGELRRRRWNAAMMVALSRDGIRVDTSISSPEQPQLACFSSGELTPFRLDLSAAELPSSYRIDGSPDGALTLERRDATP